METISLLWRFEDLACDWTENSEHSKHILGVHGFCSLTVKNYAKISEDYPKSLEDLQELCKNFQSSTKTLEWKICKNFQRLPRLPKVFKASGDFKKKYAKISEDQPVTSEYFKNLCKICKDQPNTSKDFQKLCKHF